ncbi:MAG: CocE/NonD family hydrolase [Candidatus Limivicinus sp.]
MKKTLCMLLALLMLLSLGSAAFAEGDVDDVLRIENGALQPILEVSDLRDPDYSNENSDILRFCVYVETDHDTDSDGMADLVKVFVQVPRPAVEGKYKCATIYDPTPYNVGTYEDPNTSSYMVLYREKRFDYDRLYRACGKREAEGEMSSMDAALSARPDKDWNYSVPISSNTGYRYATVYDYYLARGYAVVEASGIGTYGSEGFELCGTHLERDSHAAVVEWLAGDRRAFTDKTHNIEIKADWSNGNVAMTGCSYGGTLPFAVATTGVKGLKTIIPVAGIASWYDYTNSQGVPTILEVNYTDSLAAYNCGGTFLDKDWTVPNEDYGSWLWSVAQDQLATNGNYAEAWEESDYAKDWEGLKCSALIVQGLNDFNVNTRHADKMMQAFSKAGQTAKMVLHQDGHNFIYNTMVKDELWNEIQNRWLAHYLYDVDNDAEDMPTVLAQSNIDGQFYAYDSWRDFHYIEAPVSYSNDKSDITTEGLAQYASYFILEQNPDLSGVEHQEEYFMSLDFDRAAFYPIELPENTTVYGVPEIHLKLASPNTDYEGLMISAVLVDVADDGEPFKAYKLKNRLNDRLPSRVIGEYEGAGYWGDNDILEYVQDSMSAKIISFGYTDLNNPGHGDEISEYTEIQDLEAGKYYDYTFYMLPTVYTVAPGHTLELILTTWDPYRAFLDESFSDLDLDKDSELVNYDYRYTVDNTAIRVMMPVAD